MNYSITTFQLNSISPTYRGTDCHNIDISVEYMCDCHNIDISVEYMCDCHNIDISV